MADYTTTTQMLPWVQPYAEGYLGRAQQVADSPYQAYGGQRVADMNPWQEQGLMAQAQRGMSGSPVMSAANLALPGMFQGGGQAAQNPYGPVQAQANPYGNVKAQANPYGPVQAQSNAYAGSNPYLDQNINSTLGDMSQAWNTIQKPQWDTAMSRSGSFGNANLAQANQLAQGQLQKNMGQIAGNMRMQDYTQQQQLGESAANRALQAAQFNAGMGENFANRSLQADTFNAGMGENFANRAQQAATTNMGFGESFAGRQDSMYTGGQNRALSALGLAPSFAQNDYNDINQLKQAGQGYTDHNQRLLDNQYAQFLESRAYPQQQLGIMGDAIGRIQGSQTTQPGASSGAQAVGGLATGAALYNLLFGGKP